MGKQIEYVVETACVNCTKGSAPTTLKATTNSRIGSELRIVETDTTPTSFAGTFGFCTTLQGPCAMANLPKWFITNADFISGSEIPCVTKESFLVCTAGGGAIMPENDGQSANPFDTYLKQLIADIYHKLLGNNAACAFGNDPVNMSTGNFIYSKDDIEIPGRFPIAFKRFYNAMGDTEGILGKNWTHNYNIFLHEDGKNAKITFDDGHMEEYYRRDDGSYIPPPDHQNTLVHSDDGYTLILPSMESYLFHNQGCLLSISDLNGNTTSLSYKDGLLAEVANASGSLSFTYNKSRQIVKIVDHSGRIVSYEYNNTLLVAVTHPTGAVYRYEYGANGKISNIINPLGITAIHNKYDEQNRTVEQCFPDDGFSTIEYDDPQLSTISTEQNGNKIVYVHDKDFRTTQIIYEDSEERFEYNKNNKRTLRVDRNGNSWSYGYDDRGNLTKSTDPMGGSSITEYNEFNKPVKIIGSDGGVTGFEFDPKGNVIRSIDPLQRETQFEHDSHGLIVGLTMPDNSGSAVKYDERGNILTIVEADGSRTQYEYDSLNRVIKTINGEGHSTLFDYNAKGDIVSVTDAQNNIRRYEYNLAGKVTKIVDFNGCAIKYKYNELGAVEEIINQAAGSTKFTYDLMWNVTSVTNPNGNTVHYAYDQYQRVVQSIDEEGNVTNYEHDYNGNVTAAISPLGARTEIKYDALDRQQEIIEPNGAVTKLEYDKAGNLVKVTDALGNATKREYDLAGQLVCLTDALGNKTEFTYTALGQVESVTNANGDKQLYSYYPGGKLRSTVLPCGESETYGYDKVGNMTKITDALGNETSLIYDCLDRVTEIINPLGHSKKFRYDAVGNITFVVDEKGHQTQYKYSALGDIVEAIDAAGHSTKYDYDGASRLTKVEQYRLIDDTFAGIKRPEFQVTTYERNKKGEVVSLQSPLGKIVKLGYDGVGNVTSKLDEDGLETLYEYNLVGKLTKVAYADGKTVEFNYNALKQLTSMRDWLGTTKIELDALGRAEKVTDFEDKVVRYQWDAIGQKTKIIYPDESEVKYQYNASGRLQSVLSESGVTNYAYDAMGRITERILPDRTTTNYKMNPLGRLTNLTHSKNDEILDQLKYSYDPTGNITQIDKYRVGVEADSGVFQYSYDPLGRLVTATHGDAGKIYRYDELGNRINSWQNGGTIKHSYNARNQLIRTQDGDAVQEYRYDERGNLTQITENGQLKAKYTFDATNMMVGAFTTGKGKAEYAYNGFRNRVKKLESFQGADTSMSDPCKEIRYILDMTLPYNNLLMTQGAQSQNFVWGNDLISSDGNDKFYYLQDHLGSPIRLLGEDQSNTPLAYDEFGVPLVGVQRNQNNPFGFTGYQIDDVSGLYYAQARYYEPNISHMLSPDTHWNPDNMSYGDISPKAARRVVKPDIHAVIQSNNLYVYCMNNPVRFYDPIGKTAAEIFGGAWALGGGAAVSDGPLPFGDAVGLVIGLGGTLIAGGVLIYEGIQSYNNRAATSKGLPTTGEPNTDQELLNPDGTVKQRRHYGPDGKAEKDIDYNHPGEKDHKFPHEHDWDWSKNPPRQGAKPCPE